MHSKLFFSLVAVATLSVTGARAQSPAPIIDQAQTAPIPVTPAPVSSPVNNDATQSAIKLLEEIKAANDNTLKKQEATLETLDELQKAAEQIKIFTKRG
jgi:hypothetical protein